MLSVSISFVLLQILSRLCTNYLYKMCPSCDHRVFFNYRNQSTYISYKFLATSNTYSTAGHSFQVGSATAAESEQEVCQAVWKKLQPTDIPEPTREIWDEEARGFYEQWDFQYCIGSTDGKHVTL